VLDVANGYRSRGYPLDIMVIDWFYWTRMGQLDIDPGAFPDPQAMNRQLHEQGVHSIISVWPRFEKESRYFDFLAAKGWLLKDADGKPVDGLAERSDRAGALIDSTNRQAREWYWDRIRDNIAAAASTGSGWTRPSLISCPTGISTASDRAIDITISFPCCIRKAWPKARVVTVPTNAI
jgi:alpha-glucosidase (family GH31 glycosyl hydrolase)